MRVRLASVAVVMLLSACGAAPATSVIASPNASTSAAAQRSPSLSQSPSVSAASPSAAELGVGDVGEVVASNLRLRAAPGVDAEVVGIAMQWWYGWIYEGPVEADGFTWYRVELHPTDKAPFGCPTGPDVTCNPPRGDGWLAAGPPDGGSWFARVPCPSYPAGVEELSGVHHFLIPSCFGSTPISLSGNLTDWCAERPNSPYIKPEWLSNSCWHLGSPHTAGIWLHFRDTPPAVPSDVTVAGHFDDPEALTCIAAKPDGPSQEQAIRHCRSNFVVDEWAYAE